MVSLVYYFVNKFSKLLGAIAHNVPAVYDVFASPIKETAGFLYRACKNVGGVERGSEAT
jgi:hypothetical protein